MLVLLRSFWVIKDVQLAQGGKTGADRNLQRGQISRTSLTQVPSNKNNSCQQHSQQITTMTPAESDKYCAYKK